MFQRPFIRRVRLHGLDETHRRLEIVPLTLPRDAEILVGIVAKWVDLDGAAAVSGPLFSSQACVSPRRLMLH